MTDYRNKTAVITGAGSGIGRAAAVTLASMGMNLVLCARRREMLEETAALSSLPETRFLVEAGDLTDENQIRKIASDTVQKFGGADVLINNAGMALNKPLLETTTEEYDRIMAVNARTPFLMCREFLPALKKSACPMIINIGSVVALHGYINQSAYSASKHALRGMTEALAKEVQGDGIRVHLICPGGVYTDMIKKARPDLTPEGLIVPQDIADIIRFCLEHRGNAVIDEISVRRAGKEAFL